MRAVKMVIGVITFPICRWVMKYTIFSSGRAWLLDGRKVCGHGRDCLDGDGVRVRLMQAVQLTHCAVHSPPTWAVVTLSRFQVLIAAMCATRAASAGSS
jgi:hypothetical protein